MPAGGQALPASRRTKGLFLSRLKFATWLIHGVYLGSLVRRFSRLRQQLKEVKKGK